MSDFQEQLSPQFLSALKKLEFDKVLERIGRLAATELGRQKSLTITPRTDGASIRLELLRVTEVKELVVAEGGLPLDGTKNIISSLRKIAVENQVLSVQELLDIASTLRASHAVHSFLTRRKTQYPDISCFLQTLHMEKVVEYNISQALDDQGFVKDSASKELKQIRQDLIHASEALRKRLESILRQVSEQDFLQEEILTTRDGRMVIPVKSEHKSHVPGFIHSSSASGQTVYIEPAETLDLNNALKELQLREQREVYKILSALTGQVRDTRQNLEENLSTLTALDLLSAKARYSIEVLGNPPAVSEEPVIKLFQARHPVLLQRHKRDEIVPLDFEIGREVSTILITGPNAGGKTVALKTVGLLTLCAMAGIHISAASESHIYPYRSFFVDIGDDQSIESDLSTFSSHLLNLKQIAENADHDSLVLIDEVGAGTDPAEGGALAAAMLHELTERKTTTIATTHDGLLKAFAHESAGMENASMEFDQASLRPTYRFRLGVPGSSFAFELAQRIGIPAHIIDGARSNLGSGKIRLENLIVDLERQSQEMEKQKSNNRNETERLHQMTTEFELKTRELKKETAVIKKRALSEAKEIVRSAKAAIEREVKEIRESKGQPEIIRAARKNMQAVSDALGKETVDETPLHHESVLFSPGDHVRLHDGTRVGEIVQVLENSAIVLWGNARMRVSTRDLVRQDKDPRTFYPSSSSPLPQIVAATEIDLRGMMGDEAVNHVQQFIDNAFVAGLHRVDIIHGKGTGALRKRVTAFLKSNPHVKSFRLGEWNEGGTGVTVVEIA